MFIKILTQYIDRILQVQSDKIHATGAILGQAEILSRQLSPFRGQTIETEELSINWFTVDQVEMFHSILVNGIIQSIKDKQTDYACTTACLSQTARQI